MDLVTIDDIQRAASRLRGIVHLTPVLTSTQLNHIAAATVSLKCENFQRIGAFKFRGAYNAVAIRLERGPFRQAVTLSSGNHAQGLALACRLRGLTAQIVMHHPINRLKRQAVEQYGAVIHETRTRGEAEQLVQRLIEELPAIHIHAFNDPPVIAGQGTVALELLQTVPDLDAILAPIGGGGLLSGISIAAHAVNPAMKIYACEPMGALDAIHSLRENRIVPMPIPQTIADGLRTSVGDVTLPILRQHVESVFTVEESEIVRAMRFAFERLKIVIEPSSAVALAPLLREEPTLRGRRVGVIITGGNVDLSTYFDDLPV
jgi:threonine dehydratase